MSAGSVLRPTDVEHHEQLGIPTELLEAAGVVRVTDAEARVLLCSGHPGDLAGVVYPYRDPATGAWLTCRLRRDHPEIENGKPRDKYLSAFGDSKHLFFPPGAGKLLADTSAPIIVVEAEKSVLAIMAAAERTGRRVLAIGTGGCWGWRGRIGKTTDATGARVDEKGPLPDLARVIWPGRDAVIVFDANAATNDRVQTARRALAKDLAGRSAKVRIGALAVEDGINGPDDYVGRHGDAALFALMDGTTPCLADDSPAGVLDAAGLTDPVNIEGLETTLRALVDLLRTADPLRVRLVREAAVTRLKAAKVSGAAVLVDVALATLSIGDHNTATLTIADDEPAAKPVNGAALLDETSALIRRHVVMTEAQADAVALWTGAAHAIDAL